MIDNSSKEFIYRHIGPSEEEQKTMLKAVGYSSLEDLMENTVPEKILLKNELKINDPLSENDALKKLKSISKQNKIFRNFIGMGYYNSFTPNVILRNILENPGWYTSYTPYQPEVAQGRLEMLLNFQQLIIDLTGMDIANASLLDEATAAAEAVGLSQRLDKNDSKKIFVSSSCNPQTIDLIKTRTEPFGLELIIGNEKEDLTNISENIKSNNRKHQNDLEAARTDNETLTAKVKAVTTEKEALKSENEALSSLTSRLLPPKVSGLKGILK